MPIGEEWPWSIHDANSIRGCHRERRKVVATEKADERASISSFKKQMRTSRTESPSGVAAALHPSSSAPPTPLGLRIARGAGLEAVREMLYAAYDGDLERLAKDIPKYM